MNNSKHYKTYVIGCKSRISGQESTMKKNGKQVEFKMRHYAERYADKYRTMDNHYYVIEL